MRIEDVFTKYKLSEKEAKVCDYIMKHNDSVFPYEDDELRTAFPDIPNDSSRDWIIYNLEKKGLIQKYKPSNDKHVYYGSPTAIAELKKRDKNQNP